MNDPFPDTCPLRRAKRRLVQLLLTVVLVLIGGHDDLVCAGEPNETVIRIKVLDDGGSPLDSSGITVCIFKSRFLYTKGGPFKVLGKTNAKGEIAYRHDEYGYEGGQIECFHEDHILEYKDHLKPYYDDKIQKYRHEYIFKKRDKIRFSCLLSLLSLGSPDKIIFKVRNLARQAVADAFVAGYDEFKDNLDYLGKTDKNGILKVPIGYRECYHYFYVIHDAYLPDNMLVNFNNRPYTFSLYPKGTSRRRTDLSAKIAVTILDAKDRPIEGACLVDSQKKERCCTDSTGTCNITIRESELGNFYSIEHALYQKGNINFTHREFTKDKKKTKKLVPRHRNIIVKVVDEDARPIPELTVTVSLEADGTYTETYKTTKRGNFKILKCPVTRIDLSIKAEGYELVPPDPMVILAGTADTRRTLKLHAVPQDLVLKGVIKDKAGAPVENVDVLVTCVRCGKESPIKRKTHKNGLFETPLWYQHDWEILVSIEHPGYLKKLEKLYRIDPGPVTFRLSKFKKSLLILLNRSGRMARTNFSSIKRGTVELLRQGQKSDGWGSLSLGAFANGRIEILHPFQPVDADTFAGTGSIKKMMALNAVGSSETLATLKRLPELMVKNEAAGKGKDKSRIIFISTPDVLLESIEPDDLAISQLVAEFIKNGIVLYIFEIAQDKMPVTKILKNICQATGGKCESIQVDRETDNIAKQLLSLQWHKAVIH